MKRNKIFSVLGMIAWLLFASVLVVGTRPPRCLTAAHLQQFAIVPLGAFIVALPGVPKRWFAYFGALGVAPLILIFSYQINGTSRRLGWDGGISQFALPVLLMLAVITSSFLAAWLRQTIQTGIGRLIGHANQALERTRQ